jgi:hypothetical protein
MRRLFRAARYMRHQHNAVVRQFVESEHRLFRRPSYKGQQLNTIPIQYYFIARAGGIQDRIGLNSERMAWRLGLSLAELNPVIDPVSSSRRYPDQEQASLHCSGADPSAAQKTAWKMRVVRVACLGMARRGAEWIVNYQKCSDGTEHQEQLSLCAHFTYSLLLPFMNVLFQRRLDSFLSRSMLP